MFIQQILIEVSNIQRILTAALGTPLWSKHFYKCKVCMVNNLNAQQNMDASPFCKVVCLVTVKIHDLIDIMESLSYCWSNLLKLSSQKRKPLPLCYTHTEREKGLRQKEKGKIHLICYSAAMPSRVDFLNHNCSLSRLKISHWYH